MSLLCLVGTCRGVKGQLGQTAVGVAATTVMRAGLMSIDTNIYDQTLWRDKLC